MQFAISRRQALFIALAAIGARPAFAQTEEEAIAWGRAVGVTWTEILNVPLSAIRDGSSIPMYRVAQSDDELGDARRRARTKREATEAEIARCRAMVAALGPAPGRFENWQQAIVDRIAPDQIVALDRLAVMARFVETTGMRFVSGELPFTPVMRMCHFAVFGETQWIMGASMNVTRLAATPGSFVDLWTRMSSLDSLIASTAHGVFMRILNRETADHIAPAQTALFAAAQEARQIGQQFTAANLPRLNVNGEQRQRLAPLLPQIAALAAAHADRVESTARGWPALTYEQVLAMDAGPGDEPPQFVLEAGPLLLSANVDL